MPCMDELIDFSSAADAYRELEESTKSRSGSMNLYRTKLKVCATCISLSYPLQALI